MRLEKLRMAMAKENIDGFIITQPQNRRYLSGFTGSAGVLIITQDRQVLATDSRYYQQVQDQCPDWELFEAGYKFSKQMLELLRGLELGARRVGFEAQHVSVSTLHAWERALKGRLVLVHTEGFVEELREQKEVAELAILKKAIALGDEALVHITNWMQPGMTELQVAWEIESYLRTHGAQALAFAPTVASGPNAAKPHHDPSDRVIQKGEPIIMDFGCIVDDYCSDLTRTVCLDQPADEQYMSVWNTVLASQQAAIAGAKAGMTSLAIDALARNIISQAGYGDYFGHSLGHGIGLAVHEGPRLSYASDNKISSGVVVTAEPGIYIPGWGGVRIEDIIVINDDEVAVLSSAPKEAILAR